jgi:hypothetical protein
MVVTNPWQELVAWFVAKLVNIVRRRRQLSQSSCAPIDAGIQRVICKSPSGGVVNMNEMSNPIDIQNWRYAEQVFVSRIKDSPQIHGHGTRGQDAADVRVRVSAFATVDPGLPLDSAQPNQDRTVIDDEQKKCRKNFEEKVTAIVDPAQGQGSGNRVG